MAKKKAAKKTAVARPTPVATTPPAAGEPPVPGSAPTEHAPDESSAPKQAKVGKAGKQSGDSCDGCQYDYDSTLDPGFGGPKPIRMCTHSSPSIETGGKKLAPCPAEGEGIGLYALTPDEVELVHKHRLKKGQVGAKGKRS